jgi:hypothetical protein
MNETPVTEARTELVLLAADCIDHIFCGDCWVPGSPLLCGEPDDGGGYCDDNCNHSTCSMCEVEWQRHLDEYHEE